MAQLFQSDGTAHAGSGALAQATATTVLLSNSVSPPFGNCKFRIQGGVQVTPEASATALTITVKRNPAGENTTVMTASIDVTGGKAIMVPVAAVDSVPDGRPCAYSVTITQTGAAGAGTYGDPSLLSIDCISG